MILLDVNVLVQAHREDASHHREVEAWLEAELAGVTGVAVSELVLSGWLRVVTHPKVFKEPTPVAIALEFLEHFRARRRVSIAEPGHEHWGLFIGLCRRLEARGNVVADAYHAALAIEYGFEWVTLDRGFARFPALRWRHPLD